MFSRQAALAGTILAVDGGTIDGGGVGVGALLDLGTAASPGGNTFTGNTTAGVGGLNL